jgi:hypothetical protein
MFDEWRGDSTPFSRESGFRKDLVLLEFPLPLAEHLIESYERLCEHNPEHRNMAGGSVAEHNVLKNWCPRYELNVRQTV